MAADDIKIDRPDARSARRWWIGLGVAFCVLGLVAVVATLAATLATVLLFGVLFLVAGVAQLVETFRARSDDFGWDLLAGVVYTLVGLLIVWDPVAGAVGQTLLIATFFLFVGVLRIVLYLRASRRQRPAAAYLVLGVVDALLGVLILAGWPETGTWVIGLFLGIELLFTGIALIALGRAVHARGG